MEDSTEYMSLRADLPLLCSSPTDTLTHTNRTTFTHSSSAPHALSLEHRQSAFRSNAKAGFVISKIEEVLESMIDCFLKDGKELVIELKSNRKGGSATSSNAETKQRKTSGITSVRFPGKSEHEVWKFTVLLRILELSHEALASGSVSTKRDIFYQDPELFKKQVVVDRYVDDLAYTFGIDRDALNVVAAAKCLLAGDIKLIKIDGNMVNCAIENEGILLPSIQGITSTDIASSQWVLVVEKEATFRTLATSHYWQRSKAGRGILITAKGYPDIATRAFLFHLNAQHPYLPIHGLFDFDPDGLGILSTYKHGSASLSHETNLLVPSMSWLGVRSSDLVTVIRNEGIGRKREKTGLMKLTKRDRWKASKMLEHDSFQYDVEQEWRRELQVMLMLSIKAEIQYLGNGEALAAYLDEKLLELN